MEAALRENYKDRVFESMIKKRIKLEERPMFHKNIAAYNPKSSSAEEFITFAKELIKKLRRGEK